MKLKIYQIDAFTNKIFKGNYAAVVILQEDLDDTTMQNIATENNLSETAFIKRINDNIYTIRWFSPICEIDFCGHATLAASFVIFENENIKTIYFNTLKVGTLEIQKQNDNYIKMIFPNTKPTIVNDVPKIFAKALSIQPKEVLINNQAYYLIYENEQDIYDISLDLEVLKELKPYDIAISAVSKEYDFITRYYWPANGGDEDPVTGSIHTALAPYWAEKLNKNNLIAYQASKRGGVLKCEVYDNKVILLGQAVKYMDGYIYI
jgi:PhzF family phenazine biosynthesis protein